MHVKTCTQHMMMSPCFGELFNFPPGMLSYTCELRTSFLELLEKLIIVILCVLFWACLSPLLCVHAEKDRSCLLTRYSLTHYYYYILAGAYTKISGLTTQVTPVCQLNWGIGSNPISWLHPFPHTRSHSLTSFTYSLHWFRVKLNCTGWIR